MAKGIYWKKGETLNYKNETVEIIEAGEIIDLKTRIGIAGTTINPSEIGSMHVCGVFEIEKASEEIAVGANVYFNGTQITIEEGSNTPVGHAAAYAATSDTTVLVKLLG